MVKRRIYVNKTHGDLRYIAKKQQKELSSKREKLLHY
jgi:uncharacterized C2H2 Zn-finger protein